MLARAEFFFFFWKTKYIFNSHPQLDVSQWKVQLETYCEPITKKVMNQMLLKLSFRILYKIKIDMWFNMLCRDLIQYF